MTTSVSPDARRIWRGARFPLLFLALIFGMGVVIVLATAGSSVEDLDPGSYQPGGSHAVAKLLGDQGVGITTVRTVADAGDAIGSGEVTLLVVNAELVDPQRLAALTGRAADSVVVGANQDTLNRIAPVVHFDGQDPVSVHSPDCTVEAAVAAGGARTGGAHFQASNADTRICYGGAMAQLAQERGTTTLLGTGLTLSNESLANDGNAALSMHLLGKHAKLVWYVPSPGDIAAGTPKQTFYDLIPAGWKYGVLQLGIAAVLLALWRGRRLGPVVTEPLPIVVRAAETAEGRARLYRRAGAADHAGETLREATRARLRPLLGLPVDADPGALVATTAARTGRADAEIGALLYGAPVTGDAGLVALADALDEITRRVGES